MPSSIVGACSLLTIAGGSLPSSTDGWRRVPIHVFKSCEGATCFTVDIDRGHFVGRRLNRVAVVMRLPETTKPFTTNMLAFGYPYGEGGQPLSCEVELLGLLWEHLICLQIRGRRNLYCLLKQSVPVPVRCPEKRQSQKGVPRCHCRLPTGELGPFDEHFKKRLRTFSILAKFPLVAVARGG